MLANGLIDGVIKEPLGGAHTDLKAAAEELKKEIKKQLKTLTKQKPEQRIEDRIEKFGGMGVYK